MTIRDLFRWAEEIGVADFTLRIQFRDEGGVYEGDEAIQCITIDNNERTVVI